MVKNVKLLKKGLIVLDVILVIVAFVFLFNYLLFPQSIEWLNDLPQEEVLVPTKLGNPEIFKSEYYRTISQLPNPIIITKPEMATAVPVQFSGPPLSSLIRVDGTMPESDPKIGSAFLFIIPKNQSVVVFAGDEIMDNSGEKVRELSGVKVVEVYLDKVVFDYNGKKETLQAPAVGDAGAMGEVTVGAVPGNFDIKSSRSKKMSSSADKEVWQIDPSEAAMMQNSDKLN